MAAKEEAKSREEMKSAAWRNRLMVAQIVIANAVPVIGVWFLDWQALRPIFFYWLDGLLGLCGLGAVAAVVTNREQIKASGAKLWLIWFAAIGLLMLILALPSVFTAMCIVSFLGRDASGMLHEVFSGYGIWVSLLVVIGSHTGQTMGELNWKPALTIKDSGKERFSLFFHRSLVLGLLVSWVNLGYPPRRLLVAFVLIVACLYTYTQLYPARYLRLIGFTAKSPVEIEEDT